MVHPNIIHVRDFGEQGDMMYLVTDLLPGVSLGGMVSAEGHLALDEAEQFVRELSHATAAVHSTDGFISGLHPDIMRVVQENGEERLAISSAGIGGMQDLLATMNVAALRGQEAPNELSYVAPELLMGNAGRPARRRVHHRRADVLHGDRPPAVPGGIVSAAAGTHDDGEARRRRRGAPDIGADAAATIMRCIASDAAERFSTAAEVTQALGRRADSHARRS